MKKKPYILPKNKAIKVSDPIINFYRNEDEKIMFDLIEESTADIKFPLKTYKNKSKS